MIFIIILHIKNGNQYSQNDLGVRKLDKKCTFHVIGVLVISMHLLLLYILEMLACISSIKTLPINIDSLSHYGLTSERVQKQTRNRAKNIFDTLILLD